MAAMACDTRPFSDRIHTERVRVSPVGCAAAPALSRAPPRDVPRAVPRAVPREGLRAVPVLGSGECGAAPPRDWPPAGSSGADAVPAADFRRPVPGGPPMAGRRTTGRGQGWRGEAEGKVCVRKTAGPASSLPLSLPLVSTLTASKSAQRQQCAR